MKYEETVTGLFNSVKNEQTPYASIEAQGWNRNMLEEWYSRLNGGKIE
jgi:hypothetical protein